ncbi:hypothetical protein [Sediminimonas sp.]|uniref:hypothetical protein n=1 Tax=Sediminimonas sp. TaxID=2823379 RepID=UPI0025EC1E9B|nr:hypothetical protein [Sediminimonas sp.]
MPASQRCASLRRARMSRRAAVLGLGACGRGWAMLLRHAGWDVALFDPHPGSA